MQESAALLPVVILLNTFLKDYIIQVVNALNQIRPDELSFQLQFASNSTLAVPLECI